MALFCTAISLLICCLEDLSLFASRVLKSLSISVLLSISFLEVLQAFPYIFGCSYVRCLYVYNVYAFLIVSSLEYYEVSFCISFMAFVLKSILSDISIATPAFLFPVHMLGIFFFPTLYFKSV